MKKGLSVRQLALAKEAARTRSSRPYLDDLLLELSASAGLTAQEISDLSLRDVADHRGRLRKSIEVQKSPQ